MKSHSATVSPLVNVFSLTFIKLLKIFFDSFNHRNSAFPYLSWALWHGIDVNVIVWFFFILELHKPVDRNLAALQTSRGGSCFITWKATGFIRIEIKSE